MESHGVGQALQSWVNNDLIAGRKYAALEGLATDGTATIKITRRSNGTYSIVPVETHEEEVASLAEEKKELEKTVKTQERQIASLEKKAVKKAVKKKRETVEGLEI